MDEQSFHILVRARDVYLLEHAFQYVEGEHPIILTLKSPEQLTKNELFIVSFGALLHESEAEGSDKLLDVLMSDLQVFSLFDFPGVADEVYELSIIENCHGHIGVEVHELLASDGSIILVLHTHHLAPFIEHFEAEVCPCCSNGETVSLIWVEFGQSFLNNEQSPTR